MIYLKKHYIYSEVEKLVKRFKTRDPFEILDCMNVVVYESDKFEQLKGFCFLSCQTIYVMLGVLVKSVFFSSVALSTLSKDNNESIFVGREPLTKMNG